jgi:hypothetical protein
VCQLDHLRPPLSTRVYGALLTSFPEEFAPRRIFDQLMIQNRSTRRDQRFGSRPHPIEFAHASAQRLEAAHAHDRCHSLVIRIDIMPVFPPIRPYPTIHTDPRTGDDQCPPPSSLEEIGQVRGGEGR